MWTLFHIIRVFKIRVDITNETLYHIKSWLQKKFKQKSSFKLIPFYICRFELNWKIQFWKIQFKKKLKEFHKSS